MILKEYSVAVATNTTFMRMWLTDKPHTLISALFFYFLYISVNSLIQYPWSNVQNENMTEDTHYCVCWTLNQNLIQEKNECKLYAKPILVVMNRELFLRS